ncbi:MAG: hypothetical protein JXA41_07320 [Deltaproteobacteria bacterium]|nr:hypothetical protein [Deltaproteobacteria bacterium]
MKKRFGLIVLAMCFMVTPVIYAQQYGKIRALQKRADDVVKLRNAFVVHVLDSYAIPFDRNEQGTVVRINMEGKWLDIAGIDIIPILKNTAGKNRQVIAHEIYFYTESGVLGLMSETTIR